MTLSNQPALATPESLTISAFLAPSRKQASPACSIEPLPKKTYGITNLVIDIFAPSPCKNSISSVLFSRKSAKILFGLQVFLYNMTKYRMDKVF
jgi:hypothetical protein